MNINMKYTLTPDFKGGKKNPQPPTMDFPGYRIKWGQQLAKDFISQYSVYTGR